MNWKQLQYVLAVEEEGSVTKAAKKLYLAQPSLSLSIKALEEELAVSLFEREQGTMRLTYAGQLFCDWAKSTIHSYEQLERKLTDVAEGRRCLLRVGVNPHRSAILMPGILEAFYAMHPACEVHLDEQPTSILRKRLEERLLDVLLDTPHPDEMNYISEKLEMERILLAVPERFAAKLPPELRQARKLPLQALQDFPFIMMEEDQGMGNMARHICAKVHFEPDVRLVCVGIENALRLAQHQLGVIFIPEIFSLNSEYTMNLRYYSIEGIQPERQICLVYPRDTYQNRYLKDLLQLFREQIARTYRIGRGQEG